jgi:hypothetical protein
MSDQEKEDWLHKAIQGAIVGLLIWNVATTHNLSISLAVLQEKVARVEQLVTHERP